MKNVVIDAGHGGKDYGAIAGGVREKDIALKLALKTEKYLSDFNVNTYMTRRNDVFLELNERVSFTNRVESDCFVSWHCNAFSDPKSNGFEIFTSRGLSESDRLATLIFNDWDRTFEQRMRGDFSDGDPDKEARFAVIMCKGPAVLVETGFITNAWEREFIDDDANQDRMAEVVGRSIVQFLGLNIRDTVQPPATPDHLDEMREIHQRYHDQLMKYLA